MADDTGQSEEGAEATLSPSDAAVEADQELDTSFTGVDAPQSEEGETDASPEDADGEESSAPDEKQENTEPEADNEGEEAETSEDEDEGDTEAPDDSEAAEDEGEDDSDEGPVPYDRFKEKVEEANELESELEQIETQLETVQDEKEQLQQEVNYYLQTEEGQEELVGHLKQQGVIEDDTSQDASLEQQIEQVKQSLPNQAGEGLEQVLTQIQDQVQGLQDNQQQPQQEPDPETTQKVQQKLQQKVSSMQSSGDYPNAEAVFDPEATPGPKSLAETVFQENAGKYTDDNGLPDTDKLDELYRDTAERFNLTTGEQSDSGGQSDETSDNGEVSFDELSEEEKDRLRQQVRQDLIDDEPEVEPVEPSGGSSSTDEVSVESLQDAVEQAGKESGFLG